MAEVLRDVAAGNAKPIYNYLNNMPDLAGAVRPVLPREVVLRGPQNIPVSMRPRLSAAGIGAEPFVHPTLSLVVR
jgi:hypothetical protein